MPRFRMSDSPVQLTSSSSRIVNLENDNRHIVGRCGRFAVLEHDRDLSVSPETANAEFFMTKMGIRRRQVVAVLDGVSPVIAQAGAMQWLSGDVKMTTGVKGVGDLLGKSIRGMASKESGIKPEYQGIGTLLLEPTYKYIILEDVSEWGNGLVIEDGMFLACDGSVQQHLVARSNGSSALAGGEGLFNLSLSGNGVVALESNVPREELIEVSLSNDVLKIDGHMAVMWSSDLDFTVERSSKTLIGSAYSGEGLINVYRGTGRVLLSPVASTRSLSAAAYDASPKR